MRLDSVRELKQRAIEDVVRPMRAAAPRSMDLAFAAAPMEVTEAKPRLVALGIAPAGRNQYKLAIRLQRRSLEQAPEVEKLIRLARNEVDVRYIGRVRKRAVNFRSKHRPLIIGCSVAHVKVTAGTLGGFVKRRRGGDTCILSNNHVLANENKAKRGDAILQPGPYDRGKGADAVAKLADFVSLRLRGKNRVDSAIAVVNFSIDCDLAKIPGIGVLKGVFAGAIEDGLRVRKAGRTTGVTRGRVTAFEVDDVVVEYDLGSISFDNQIEIEGSGSGPFSDGGDSGSLIVDSKGYAVAQLFAGTDSGGRNNKGLTYATPIQAVLDSLKVDLLY